MKKKLIGFSVCMILVTIAFVPNIAADEDIEPELSLSEDEYIELRDKLSELNDQLLATDTLEQAEVVIRNTVVLLDDYDLLPADTTVDQEVELMKICFVEQGQLVDESDNDGIVNSGDSPDIQDVSMDEMAQNTEMLSKDTIVEEELTKSTTSKKQPLPLSPTGWNFLEPCLNRFPIGFEIIGEAWGSESFNSLSISKTHYSGFVYFVFGGRPIKLRNSNLVLEYWYLVYGRGQFDVSCTWKWNGKGYQTGGRFEVRGLKVELVIT